MNENVSVYGLIRVLETAEEDDEITVEVDGKEYAIVDYDWVTDKRLMLRIKKD